MLNIALYEGKSPLTQSAEAVKQLIEYVTGKSCNKLPATFALANGSQLAMSSKGDVFYMTTPTACSCPGFIYRGSCKHITAVRSGASGAQCGSLQIASTGLPSPPERVESEGQDRKPIRAHRTSTKAGKAIEGRHQANRQVAWRLQWPCK
jgi:hypothetical protein